jgi:stalled ribosome rescue protein Dom34
VISEFKIPNTEEKKQVDRFYEELRNDMVVYGQTETLEYLQNGYLDVVLTLDESWADLASSYGTQCVLVTDHRFIREFGGYGGITRWKI